jgi:Flagellin and related hook-associated proteins
VKFRSKDWTGFNPKEGIMSGLIINDNIASMNAQYNLNRTQEALNKHIGRLSSGYRVNSPADDPAGYAISQRMGAQMMSYNAAIRNANDGAHLLQTANGALADRQHDPSFKMAPAGHSGCQQHILRKGSKFDQEYQLEFRSHPYRKSDGLQRDETSGRVPRDLQVPCGYLYLRQ